MEYGPNTLAGAGGSCVDSVQIFARQNASACGVYSSKMRSWCDTGDPFCDSGNLSKVHTSYFFNYTTDAVNFVVSKFNATPGPLVGMEILLRRTTTAASSPSPTGNGVPRISPDLVGWMAIGMAVMVAGRLILQ